MAGTDKDEHTNIKVTSESESPLKPHKPLMDDDDHDEEELSSFDESSSASADRAKDIASELDEEPASRADDKDDSLASEPIVPLNNEPRRSGPAPVGQVTHGFTRPKQHKAKMVLVVLAFMILAAVGAAYGTYAHYKNDINKPAKVVTQTKVVHETSLAPTTSVPVVKLDKLGIQYPFTDSSSDWVMIQQHDSQSDFVSLGSRKLSAAQLAYVATQKAPASDAFASCSAERAMLGTIRVFLKSNLPKTSPTGTSFTDMIKTKTGDGSAVELSDRYVVYFHQQSACSDDTSVQQLQTSLSNASTVATLMKSFQLSK